MLQPHTPALYSTLADWWRLLSDPADYAKEADHHWRLLSTHAARPVHTLLELGSGGGNNASHLKARARLTLTDLAGDMLRVSRSLNPDCEHIPGDMRTLRLDRRFDAVLIHDAIMHMRTEGDLRAAIATAAEHCEPGGAILLVPDAIRETFTPSASHGGHDGDDRSLRYLSWTHDPDPRDTEITEDMVYALRERGAPLRVEHDSLPLGCFPRAVWLELIRDAGLEPREERCDYDGAEAARSFLGLKR